MKKYFLILIVFLSVKAFAQNNPIFYGGIGDGWVMNSFNKNYTAPQNKGGNGDGWHLQSFSQNYSAPQNNGGSGDGWNLANFLPNYSPLQNNGGIGDGWVLNSFNKNYTPKSNNGGIGDGWASNITPMTPLPTELLSFTGKEIDGNHLLLWTTSKEINTSHFVIEHSINANYFTELGMRDAAGNSDVPLDYEFLNTKPVVGNNFYRLKMVDIDGKYKYSNIVLLKKSAKGHTIVAYPNPAASEINVLPEGVPNGTTLFISIADASGKTIYQKQHVAENIAIPISLNSFASGIYFLNISNGEQWREVIKFSVSK